MTPTPLPAATASTAPAAPAGSWDFVYPKVDAESAPALDLRFLNESFAGEHGFIALSADGSGFVRGDGQPIRFWAINEMALGLTGENLRRHARHLARIGVNMGRFHVALNAKGKGTSIFDVDWEVVRNVWRTHAALKQEGIYSTISPLWPHNGFMGGWIPEEWGIDGYSGTKDLWGVFYFNERLRAAYKNWTRALYTLVNPYTGIALRDDPAVAIIQILNEDSVFWWSMDEFMTPQLRDMIVPAFVAWLTRRHGSLASALRAWGTARLPEDDAAAGRVGLCPIRAMAQDQSGDLAIRLKDQVEFYAETQRGVYQELRDFYRDELGCRQVVNAMDWTAADASRLLDLERWTLTATEVLATNRYYDPGHDGENNGWRVDPGHTYVGASALHNPARLPINIKQVSGHPFLVAESTWVSPQKHQAEGPFLIAAYQSLSGMDAYYWFCVTDEVYCEFPYYEGHRLGSGQYPYMKWTCSTPGVMAQFPANALLYRQGYVRRGEPVVRERRSRRSLMAREVTPMCEIRSYDPNRAEGTSSGHIPSDSEITPLAYLAGPVVVEFTEDRTDIAIDPRLGSLVDSQASRVRSVTGEHDWDHALGICQVDTPRAKGVCGFLSRRGTFLFEGAKITSANEYAAVWIVSLDGKPLSESRRILVQCGTRYLPADWAEEPCAFTYSLDKVRYEGFRVLNTGHMPWRADATRVEVEIANASLRRAILLDVTGRTARELPLQHTGAIASLTLPPESLYVLLEA